MFRDARFAGYTVFRDARFAGYTVFENARFDGRARFDDIRLGDGVDLELDGASAPLEPKGEHVWPLDYRLVPCLEGEGEPGMGRLERPAAGGTEEPDEESPDIAEE